MMYLHNPIFIVSVALTGSSLFTDLQPPLNTDSTCHLCLLLQSKNLPIMRQVAIIFIQLLEAGVGTHGGKKEIKKENNTEMKNEVQNENEKKNENENNKENENNEITSIIKPKKLFDIDTTAHMDRYSIEENWDSFTATQILLIRDSIFSVLRTCVCLREYPVTVLIVWNVQVRTHFVFAYLHHLLHNAYGFFLGFFVGFNYILSCFICCRNLSLDVTDWD